MENMYEPISSPQHLAAKASLNQRVTDSKKLFYVKSFHLGIYYLDLHSTVDAIKHSSNNFLSLHLNEE